MPGARVVRALAVVGALAAAVVAYGAWQAGSRATVHLALHDHAGRTRERLWADVTDARVRLVDRAGRLRAEAQLEPPHGLPRWLAPAGEAVDCRPDMPREAWPACFEAQARWVAGWGAEVEQAEVTIGVCRIERVRVERRTSRDWLLWWVPLPHVGGRPLGYHALDLHVDGARCAPAAAPTGP
jgi:hypothetical protein